MSDTENEKQLQQPETILLSGYLIMIHRKHDNKDRCGIIKLYIYQIQRTSLDRAAETAISQLQPLFIHISLFADREALLHCTSWRDGKGNTSIFICRATVQEEGNVGADTNILYRYIVTITEYCHL